MIRKKSFILIIIIVITVVLFALSGYLSFTRKPVFSPSALQQRKTPAAPLPKQRLAASACASVSGANARSKHVAGMVWIPGGKFLMGSPEGAGNTNEYPQHAVMVDGFYMDTTEVTQAEYTRVMNENPSHFKECPMCPVENVSWDDAAAYCAKVGKRLPTEAEWEYACRAGSTTLNYWGIDRNEKYAWFRENSEQKTHPAGQKKPNNFGLYDMIGNVWEWCGDWYDSTYYGKSPLHNPQGPDSTRHRVFRGGSWLNNVATLHSALRDAAVPDDPTDLFGFRCVCSP